MDSNFVGFSAKGTARHTDGQVWGGPFTQHRVELKVEGLTGPDLTRTCEHSGPKCSQSLRVRYRCMQPVASQLEPECRDRQIRIEDEN